jgi:hypothetical protein
MARPLPPRRESRPRSEEAAILLPFFGIVLLMPPIVNLFVAKEMFFGVPPVLVYLFAVWLALILGAVLVSLAAPFRGGTFREDRGEEEAEGSP